MLWIHGIPEEIFFSMGSGILEELAVMLFDTDYADYYLRIVSLFGFFEEEAIEYVPLLIRFIEENKVQDELPSLVHQAFRMAYVNVGKIGGSEARTYLLESFSPSHWVGRSIPIIRYTPGPHIIIDESQSDTGRRAMTLILIRDAIANGLIYFSTPEDIETLTMLIAAEENEQVKRTLKYNLSIIERFGSAKAYFDLFKQSFIRSSAIHEDR